MDKENGNPEEKIEEKIEEKKEDIIEEKKPENEVLVNDFRESKFKEPKTLALKYKIIIIVAISIVIIGIVTVITLIVMKKGSHDKDEDEDIEVLPPVIIEPKSEYTHCIIFLHGYESSPEEYQPFFENDFFIEKKNNTKIILMRAPYQIMTFNKLNKTSWFDIIYFPLDSSTSYNFTDATRSRKAVEKVIKQEAKLLNGKYENIFIGGHSQGACTTLYTAYNMAETIGGVICFSGLLFPQATITGDKNKLKVFLGHGFGDKAIPMTFHNETIKRIENFEGVQKFYYEDMGHNIGDEEIYDAEGFLNNSMI